MQEGLGVYLDPDRERWLASGRGRYFLDEKGLWRDMLSPRTQKNMKDIFRWLVNYGVTNNYDRVERETKEILDRIEEGIRKYGTEDPISGFIIAAPFASPLIELLENLEEENRLYYLSEIAERLGGRLRIVAFKSKYETPGYLRASSLENDLSADEKVAEEKIYEIAYNEMRRLFNNPSEDSTILALEIEIKGSSKPCNLITKRVYRKEI